MKGETVYVSVGVEQTATPRGTGTVQHTIGAFEFKPGAVESVEESEYENGYVEELEIQ